MGRFLFGLLILLSCASGEVLYGCLDSSRHFRRGRGFFVLTKSKLPLMRS